MWILALLAGLLFGISINQVVKELQTVRLLERLQKGLKSRPVVCVCRIEDRVGVVLRKDYEKASCDHWKKIESAEKAVQDNLPLLPNGRLIGVWPVYVFDPDSSEYHTLLKMCWAERAVFTVPAPFQDNKRALRDAYRHFFGDEWPGKSEKA